MITNKTHSHLHTLGGVLVLAGLPLLWWVSQPQHDAVFSQGNFLLLHTALEIVTVVVALLVFSIGHRAMLGANNHAIVVLGHLFLGVALLDYLHLMSYVGMPDMISTNTAHKSMFFWLCARMLAACALLAYTFLSANTSAVSNKPHSALSTGLTIALVVVLAYVGLAMPAQLPQLFNPAQGLTALKIDLEWLVVFLNGATLAMLWRLRATLPREQCAALGFALALSMISEIFLMLLGPENQGSINILGHLYKLAAYVFLYQATFNEALRRPLQDIKIQSLREKIALSTAPDGVLWVDQSGQILMVNPAIETLSGYVAAELLGRNVNMLLPRHMQQRHMQSMQSFFYAPHPRAMGNLDLQLLRRDGKLIWVDISLGHWQSEGQRYAIAYVRDLTERKQMEATLRRQATHDELTGLANRWFFHIQLTQALGRAQREGTHMAVLLLDLDYFKTINDSFGHAVGDALLVQVASRIQNTLRENDVLARLGGDEFVVLLTDLTAVEEAFNVAAKLLHTLQTAYQLEGKQVYSGASMGLAFFPDDAHDGDTLLRYADMAMYQAKNAGRGTYACYSQEMDHRVHEDMQLHTKLKAALAQSALQLHYQPQLDVVSNRVLGVEALLRWHDTELGDIAPQRCIAMAEATGLILPLSEWVLTTACRQIAAWQRAGTPLRVAVNVSAQLFRQRNLAEKISKTLEQTGAQAQWLEIEITESVAMDHSNLAHRQIDALVALGCSVALDDFGTGYSSLAYLKTLPVRKLKIDKTFMDGIPEDAHDVTLCHTIIALAHNLDKTLVAEGVETPAQLDFLRQHGCETYQGWLCAMAMDASTLESWMQQALPQKEAS